MQYVQQISGVLSGLIFFFAFGPYIRAIIKKETVPSKASWIIWATVDTITLAGMIAADSWNWQCIGAMTGGWVVAVLSLFYGKRGWTWLDRFCLIGAVCGLGLWWWFQNPVVGIVTSVTIVAIASLPTIRNAWKHPEQEDLLAWTLYTVSCVLALIAIPQWTLADASQPIVFTTIETIMMILLWKPR